MFTTTEPYRKYVAMWQMMVNQNFSYFAQRISLETWWDFFLEI